MPVPGDISREHADLTVGDLAGRARVLAPHPAGGPPLLEKAGLVYDQHRTRIGQGLKGIVAHQIKDPASRPMRTSGRLRPLRKVISASGSLATFASRTICPVASTMQRLLCSNDTSIPAK